VALVIEIAVVHTPQAATNNLFAKQLTPERPDAEDLRHGTFHD